MHALRPDGISVVIVNWNSADDLARCLASLRGQTDRDFEIVVVDNGSTDGSVERARQADVPVVLVETGENLGFAEGCNRGIGAATQPWILALNNDAQAEPDLVAQLRQAVHRGGAALGMIQPLILFRERPDRVNSTGVDVHPNGVFVDRDFERPRDDAEGGGEVFCVSAGAALYRRAMLDQVRLASGYFDRTFFMYFEDVDLGWRCRLAGWDAEYLPSAIVHHHFRGSSSRRGSRFVRTHCKRNRLRTLLKNASLGYVLRALPRTALDVVYLTFTDGGFRGVARAARDGLRQRAEVEHLRRLARDAIEQRWVRRE